MSGAAGRLHGNSAPRRAAARLRADLERHCGRPTATQAAIIAQAAEIKLRLAVMDQEFIRTGARSAHASRDYLAWANSLTRLMRALNLKSEPKPAQTLTEYLNEKAAAEEAQRAAQPHRQAA